MLATILTSTYAINGIRQARYRCKHRRAAGMHGDKHKRSLLPAQATTYETLLSTQVDGNERLSDDVWATILLELERKVSDGLCHHTLERHSATGPQLQFQQLRLVCHQFNRLFKTRSQLSHRLMLSPAMKEASLPTLIKWLHCHGPSVQVLAAHCGSSCLEAALDQLQAPQALLRKVMMTHCSSSALQLMMGLHALTSCVLKSPSLSANLNSFMELPCMQKLHLTDGFFKSSGLPAHLTNLSLDCAYLSISDMVSRGNDCVTSLRRSQVLNSQLMGSIQMV